MKRKEWDTIREFVLGVKIREVVPNESGDGIDRIVLDNGCVLTFDCRLDKDDEAWSGTVTFDLCIPR